MTKVVTIRSQQMWEYLAINHKTEEYLITDLNELGKAGWELVGASFNKDLKGVAATFSWTAILKRPLIAASPPAGHAGDMASEHPAAESHASHSGAATGPQDIFDLRPA